jgi:hypothetical protein
MNLFDENPRTSAPIWLHALLISLTLVIMSIAAPANAGTLRCASRHLSPSERDEILIRARRLVPAPSNLLTLEWACWNRDFAIASLRTPTVADLDDASSWWTVRCDRKTRSWACGPATREHRIEVVITDAEQLKKVVASFPDVMSVGRAKTIITATAPLAMRNQMPLPACSEGSNDDLRWRRARFNPPNPDPDYPGAEVGLAETGPIIDFGSLRINLGSDDRPTCWDELIIVD